MFLSVSCPSVKPSAGSGTISLKWGAVEGATKYKVCKYVNGKLKVIAEVEGTSVRVNGTKAGKTYTYAVKALINGKWTKVYSGDLVSVTAK